MCQEVDTQHAYGKGFTKNKTCIMLFNVLNDNEHTACIHEVWNIIYTSENNNGWM